MEKPIIWKKNGIETTAESTTEISDLPFKLKVDKYSFSIQKENNIILKNVKCKSEISKKI